MYEFFRNKALNAKGFLDPYKPDNQPTSLAGPWAAPSGKTGTLFLDPMKEGGRLPGVTSDPWWSLWRPAELGVEISQTGLTRSPSRAVPDIGLQQRPGGQAILNAVGRALPMAVSYSTTFFRPAFPPLLRSRGPFLLYVPAPLNPAQYVSIPFPMCTRRVPGQREHDDQFTVRFDHHINNNQNLSVYYYFLDSRSSSPSLDLRP